MLAPNNKNQVDRHALPGALEAGAERSLVFDSGAMAIPAARESPTRRRRAYSRPRDEGRRPPRPHRFLAPPAPPALLPQTTQPTQRLRPRCEPHRRLTSKRPSVR